MCKMPYKTCVFMNSERAISSNGERSGTFVDLLNRRIRASNISIGKLYTISKFDNFQFSVDLFRNSRFALPPNLCFAAVATFASHLLGPTPDHLHWHTTYIYFVFIYSGNGQSGTQTMQNVKCETITTHKSKCFNVHCMAAYTEDEPNITKTN